MSRTAFSPWILVLQTVLATGLAVALLGVASCEPPRPCAGDWQCPGGEVCAQECRDACRPGQPGCCEPGRCVAARCTDETHCVVGSECRGHDGDGAGACFGLSCNAETPCPDAAYCAGQGFCAIPGCERPPGLCLPLVCSFDDDCPRGARCEGSSVCPPDVVCVWEGEPGICVGDRCRSEEDCGLGAVCHDGFCRIVPPAPPPGGAS